MPRPFIDITGKNFGRWTVLRFDRRKGRENYWLCRCDCGSERSVAHSPLKLGKSTSCGCFQKEDLAQKRTTHGDTKNRECTTEYSIWRNMINRCENPNVAAYPRYGGRGITICEKWHDYSLFLADVGRRSSPKLTLERIDNDGNYEPGNVMWATRKTQANNRRGNQIVDIDGISKTVSQWCDHFCLSRSAVRCRIYRGMSHKDAILTLVAKKSKRAG